MEKFMKKAMVVLAVVVVAIICGNGTVKAGDYWASNLYANNGNYVGYSEGSITENTERGWTANFKSPGWYGIWEAQVYQSTKLGMGNVNIAKDERYSIRFDIKSETCNKLIYILVGSSEKVAFSDWIYVKKGEVYKYYSNFIAKEDATEIHFGMGPQFELEGHSGLGEELYRYNIYRAKYGNSKYWDDESALEPMTIKCRNFYLGDIENNIKNFKAVNKKGRKIKLTWKKSNDAYEYQIAHACNKKFTKNVNYKNVKSKGTKSYIIKKLKKGKTYYFKMRVYYILNRKMKYGNWSVTKKVKIKK